jgi:hypothetical protein
MSSLLLCLVKGSGANNEETREFNDKELWPEDGSQPFVWSTDDSYVFPKRDPFRDMN